MVNIYCTKLKKVTGVVFIVLFFVQMLSFLAITNISGKLPDEQGNLSLNNPIMIQPEEYFVVNNDIVFYGGNFESLVLDDKIQIYDFSNCKEVKHLSTYISQIKDDLGDGVISYQAFDEYLFIVVEGQTPNETDPHYFCNPAVCLEIVNVTDPSNPTFISQIRLEGTNNTVIPFNDERDYRMFFINDYLYISVYNTTETTPRKEIRVIDLHDPKNPVENTTISFGGYTLYDHYIIDDYLYTLCTEDIFIVNCSIPYNFELFEIESKNNDHRFIGHNDDYLFTEVADSKTTNFYSLEDKENIDLVKSFVYVEEHIQLRIQDDHIFRLIGNTLQILDQSDFSIVDEYTLKLKYTSMKNLIVDGNRVYTSNSHQYGDSTNKICCFDISNPTRIKLLYPKNNNLVIIISVSVSVVVLGTISLMLSRFIPKWRKKKNN